MTTPLKIVIEETGEKRIMRIEGRIDATSAPILEQKISALMDEGHKRFLLDFSKVDYLSSAGMRVLLSATKKLKVKEGELALCSMHEEVMEIIKMAGFERILSIYRTEKEAFAALSS